MVILLVTFLVLLIFYSIFLFSVLIGINKLEKIKNINIPEETVSVIIPFRNESKNILESLRSLENQDYPKDRFEVIYVNDFSEDDSLEKIMETEKSCNIKVISVPEYSSKAALKKRAIQFGIENSKGEIIITTDCDCTHDSQWLKTMLSYYDEKTAFISVPSNLLKANLCSPVFKN